MNEFKLGRSSTSPHRPHLVLIEPTAPVWKLTYYEGREPGSVAACPPLTHEQTIEAIEGWKASRAEGV